MRIIFSGIGKATLVLFVLSISCNSPDMFYSASDFEKIPKIDGHFHYLTMDPQYMEFATSLNFRILNPNWDGEVSIDDQLKVSEEIYHSFPHEFAFFGTFSVDSFGEPDFARITIDRINNCLDAGAAGIKIWKKAGVISGSTLSRIRSWRCRD